MLTLEAVTHTYDRDELPALAPITMRIHPGEKIALVGASGVGKSTLLSIIGGLLTPSGGTLTFEQGAIGADRQPIAWIFQAVHNFPRRTAQQNVMMPLLALGARRREARQRADAALECVGLGHRLEHRIEQLSGGEQQRVAVARAIVPRPHLLIADEPTGQLDEATTAQVIAAMISAVDDSTALVLATHDRAVAAVCDRIVELRGEALRVS